ncbi:hypothetical protein AUJ84_03040 [Candidatus Pacearchaeota archaeon CG1_02_32_132]|nr:MAG: hypothetical protein AUJ84_03040 [Candidatus Pacearchaeota archaeon CG1_02_32_132]
MIEVELRGKIDDFEKEVQRFREFADFIEERDRFSLVYTRNEVPKDAREMLDEKVDLKLRITNGNAELILKYGSWGSEECREEISIHIKKEEFDKYVKVLGYLGWNKGLVLSTKTFVFVYKDVEFALVKSNTGYCDFEAEMIANDEIEAEKKNKHIKEMCNELGLKIFEKDEFIELINKENNTPGRKFNFEKEGFENIKKRFVQFF